MEDSAKKGMRKRDVMAVAQEAARRKKSAVAFEIYE